MIETEPQVEESTAAHVLRVRTALGLSQLALSRLLGVAERTVQRWEHGLFVRRVYLDRLDDMLRNKLENAVTTGTGYNKEFFSDGKAE